MPLSHCNARFLHSGAYFTLFIIVSSKLKEHLVYNTSSVNICWKEGKQRKGGNKHCSSVWFFPFICYKGRWLSSLKPVHVTLCGKFFTLFGLFLWILMPYRCPGERGRGTLGIQRRRWCENRQGMGWWGYEPRSASHQCTLEWGVDSHLEPSAELCPCRNCNFGLWNWL